MLHNWFRVSLLNFLFAACLGALLRFAFVFDIAWINFRHVLHGHSHVAMLGWIYLALFVLFLQMFLTKEQRESLYYKRLFYLTQISVFGMLVSFPLQGYGAWSIAFSQAHVFFSYAFAYRFLKDLRKTSGQSEFSIRFARFSLYFMLLSTLALWTLPVIMVLKLQGSAFYYATIQFYLHFQFNGWFIFACLALLFRYAEQKGVRIQDNQGKRFLSLLAFSCLLTYILAVIWSTPIPALFVINSLGVLLQLLALFYFLLIIRGMYPKLMANFSKKSLPLLWVAFFSFAAKILMQSLVLIPLIANISLTIRNYVIGFIHLILLGAISHFLIGLAQNQGLFQLDTISKRRGIRLFMVGFILSELILFVQGSLLWASMGFFPFYYEILAGASASIPLGLLFLYLNPQQKLSEL